MLVRPEIVNPQLLRPRFLLRGFPVEEQDVGPHTLCVEDAGGQAQQGMDVGLLEQFAADRLPRSTLEQHIVGKNHRSAAVLLQDREDVLEEVELLVARRRPEIIAVDDQAFLLLITGIVDDGHAALLAERRIGQHDLVLAVLAGKSILGRDRYVRGVGLTRDAVQ